MTQSCLDVFWSLGNSCNLNCYYCSWELKDGSNPFPTKEKLIPAYDHLIDQCGDFSLIRFDISGGEVVHSAGLQYILENNNNARIKFKLQSNGSAHVDLWQIIATHLYDLELTYHSETDFDHFQKVLACVRCHLAPRVQIAILPENWSYQVEIYEKLKASGFDVSLQFLYKNFTKGNNIYYDYSKDQWDYYYREKGIDPTDKPQIVQTIEFKRINNLNNFYGHMCWAGVEQFVVDNFGNVWRGWCQADGILGNLYDKTFVLNKQPMPCPKRQCRNGFDLQARKSKGSWGFA